MTSTHRHAKKAKVMPAAEDSPMGRFFLECNTYINGVTDQRERIIKTSREITINSKKLIFTLQRLAGLDTDEERAHIYEEFNKRNADIQKLFVVLAKDTQKGDAYRFRRSCSPCLQEYIEAIGFYHYFKHNGAVLTYQQLLDGYAAKDEQGNLLVPISAEDYILGLADVTGELMRYCINSVGKGSFDIPEAVCKVMQQLYSEMSVADSRWRVYELGKKLHTFQQSVAKVEEALYTVRILQSEYPPELLADLIQSRQSGGASGELNE